MSKSRVDNIKLNITSGFFNKIITLIVPFLVRTLILWRLGADFLGLSSLFTSILQVLNMTELGFTSAVVFSLYKPLAEKDNVTICALMQFYKKIYRIIGLVILVIGIVIMPFIKYLIRGNYPSAINVYWLYLMYLSNTVISYLMFAYKSVLLTADQHSGVINNINTIVVVAQGVLQAVVLLTLNSYYIYYLCVILSNVVSNICVAVITKKRYPSYVCNGELDLVQKQKIKKQIYGLAIGKFATTARNSFDSIFLSAFCGLIDVAIYTNYYYIFSALLGIIAMLRNAFTASIGNSIVTENVFHNYLNFKKINFCFLIITDISTICLVVLYQPFMQIWTKGQYVASDLIAILFGVYFFISSAGQVRSMYQEASGVWWELRYYSIFESISNIFLNAILGYKYGMYGIIIATIMTVTIFSLIALGVKLFKMYFEKGSSEYFSEIFLHFILCVVCVCVNVSIVNFINISNDVFGFAIRLIICVVVTIAITLFMCLMKKSYRENLREICRKLF